MKSAHSPLPSRGLAHPRLLALAALGLAALAPGCKKEAPAAGPPPGMPPAPVTLAPAQVRAVPIELTAVGVVQPLATVSVKAQLTAPVVSLGFEEGQRVNTGTVLATLDARPLEITRRQLEAALKRTQALVSQAEATKAQRDADVRQAEALLLRGTAQHDQARRAERRTKALVDSELVAAEDFDRLKTESSVTEAGLKASRAQIENAKSAARAAQAAIDAARATEASDLAALEQIDLQLTYTTILAPIEGRAGARLVHAGNQIKANDEALVLITQVSPISVSFNVPETELAAVLAAWPGHDQPGAAAAAPLVEVYEPGEARATTVGERGKPIASGRLSFINNTVDASTGTIQLKALFENPTELLWPGRFVDIALRLRIREGITVPSQAVQTGQDGLYVYVIGADKTAEVRPVTVERHVAGDALIASGLQAGERVVIDGLARVRKGAPVRIPAEEGDGAKPPGDGATPAGTSAAAPAAKPPTDGSGAATPSAGDAPTPPKAAPAEGAKAP